MLDLGYLESALLLLSAALLTAFCVLVWWKVVGRRVKELLGEWRRLPIFWKVILSVIFGAFCLHGSTKNGNVANVQVLPVVKSNYQSGNGENPSNLVNPVNHIKNTPTVFDEEIALGYRLDSVRTNTIYSYACPTNGVRDWAWHRAGGHSAFRRHDLKWKFPIGTNELDYVAVFQFGSVFKTPRDKISLFPIYDGVLSFRPGVSDFWTLFDEERQVFTWYDVMPYYNTNDITSIQLELRRGGDFLIRSNAIEKIYHRINPDDWDDDGLANELDAQPKMSDGDFFGVSSPFPEGANEDAYYWVELYATGHAKAATIRITCDGSSNLGNHIIIVRTNQVCRVPLLIGAEYTLESSLPVSVINVSSPEVEISNAFTKSAFGCKIRYPLDLWFENSTGRLCELKVSKDVGVSVAHLTGGCCMIDINPFGFRWACGSSCSCDGVEHEISALASWEGYSRLVYSWLCCGCGSVDWPQESEPNSVNLSLSVPRVIFTNNDGSAEISDLAPLKIGFTSSQVTNGILRLDCTRDNTDVAIWSNSNRMERVHIPFVCEVNNQAETNLLFYVEGREVSSQKDAVQFILNWSEDPGADATGELTKASTVYYPIANVINSTLWDGGRLCNPSGIVVGSNACFQVEFPNLMPPPEDIKWSIVEGPAEFMGADFGSKVYVKANTANEVVKLRVQVGDCISRPIEFTAFSVEPLSVKTTVWIIRDDRGRYAARTPIEVTNMMNEVNRIYEQIGVSFYIDSISFTNRSEWLDLSEKIGEKEIRSRERRRALVDVVKNSNGMELYFINKIAGKILGDHNVLGVVLTTNATATTLAHEIGHAFLINDIYPVKYSDGRVSALQSPFASSSSVELDWNNGDGAHYYKTDIEQKELIRRLLMCGYAYPESKDMSCGAVYGFSSGGLEGMLNVGFFSNGERKPLQKNR